MSASTAVLVGATVLAFLASVSVGPAAAAGGPEFEWGADGCDGTIVIIPTDKETIQPHLPEGFTPIVADEAAGILPPDPRLDAVFGYEVFDCSSQTVGGEHASDAVYASVWTFVEPPQELADPDYPFAFYKWVTLVTDDDQRAVLDRHGVPVSDGAGDLSSFVFSPMAAAYDVGFTIDGDGSYRATGGGSVPADGFGGQFVEYSALDETGGYALWRTDYGTGAEHGGTGMARWGEDAFAAQVLGTTEAQAWILAVEDLSFSNGSITVVPGDRGRSSDRETASGRDTSSANAVQGRRLPASGGGAPLGLGAATGLLALYLRGSR